MASVLKSREYEVKCFDLNIELCDLLKDEKVDYWDFGNYYYWSQPDKFRRIILPLVEQHLKQSIIKILNYAPDIIGFSIFDTNALMSLYVAEQVKKIDHNKTIIFGGPECYREKENFRFINSGFVDAVVVGEGEETIVELSDRYANGGILAGLKGVISKLKDDIIDGGFRMEIKDLDTVPFPYYADFDISKYRRRALPILTSRGCVARCSFCGEVVFWQKYRYRKAENILEELKKGASQYKIKEIFFNDSLINGNLKELSKLVDLIIENKMNIAWGGYARVNPIMDLDLLKRMKKAGCCYLSYGIESGSQKVLNDMNKRILLRDAEKNLRDTRKAGIDVHVNWIVGFPTESIFDFIKSLIFVFKNKKCIFNLNPGQSCGIAVNSELHKNPKKYKISQNIFLNNWHTVDFTNTIIHRRIRLNVFRKWLSVLRMRHT